MSPGYPLPIRKHGRLGEAPQFAAIEEGLQNVLLDFLVAGGDALQFLTQWNQVLDALVDVVVLLDIVGRGFDTEHVVVPHIMFGEAVLVVAPHHRVSQMHIFDLGLQFAVDIAC